MTSILLIPSSLNTESKIKKRFDEIKNIIEENSKIYKLIESQDINKIANRFSKNELKSLLSKVKKGKEDSN